MPRFVRVHTRTTPLRPAQQTLVNNAPETGHHGALAAGDRPAATEPSNDLPSSARGALARGRAVHSGPDGDTDGDELLGASGEFRFNWRPAAVPASRQSRLPPPKAAQLSDDAARVQQGTTRRAVSRSSASPPPQAEYMPSGRGLPTTVLSGPRLVAGGTRAGARTREDRPFADPLQPLSTTNPVHFSRLEQQVVCGRTAYHVRRTC